MEHMLTGDIGGRLRRARESRGLSLADAAKLTKLSIHILQAIERNDFTSLPGGMFRKAYVRTLAAEFGLNPNEIVSDYRKRFEPPVEAVAVPARDAALEEKWVQQLSASPQRSIAALAAVAVPAAAWFMLQAGAITPGALNDAANEFADKPMSQGAALALAADETPADAAPPAIATETATVPLRIEMAATGSCWVAAETDGERVMYRLMEPGERVVLEGQRTIALRLGDAGSVTLSINDGTSRSFGSDGQVVELEITPDNVESLRDGAVATDNNPFRVLG
jgi:transcriptional regulator with XRE-family HTH domain